MTTQQKPKLELVSIKVKLKLNLTADDWQLYNNVSGRNLAARRLNRAIEKKLAAGDLGSLYEPLSLYRKWGAADTEGCIVVARILDQIGINGDRFI